MMPAILLLGGFGDIIHLLNQLIFRFIVYTKQDGTAVD